MPKTSMSIGRRLATLTAAAALAGGLATTAATPAQAAPAQHTAATSTTSATRASSWVFSGVFPDPVSCNIAGLLTGRTYVCSWSVFFWSLYVWQ
jgi:hypothetical protein